MTDDPTPHLDRFASYEEARREYRCHIPERFSIAEAILTKHPDLVTRIALLDARSVGLNTYTYGGLDYLSDKFAIALRERGVEKGTSVAVFLPLSAAAMIAHLGTLKLGAVVVPLAPGPEPGLKAVLEHAEPRALITTPAVCEAILALTGPCNALFVVNDLKPRFEDISPRHDFWKAIFEASAEFNASDLRADSPAFRFYSTNGEKIASMVHEHGSLIRHLSAFEMCNSFRLSEDTAFWFSNDFHSFGTLLGGIYPALWYGCRIVASEYATSAADQWNLVKRCGITNLVTSPTTLKALRSGWISSSELKLRNIVCTEPPSVEDREWATRTLGVSVNTIYSNAQGGSAAASCQPWFETPADSFGRLAPGYSGEIEQVDEDCNVWKSR